MSRARKGNTREERRKKIRGDMPHSTKWAESSEDFIDRNGIGKGNEPTNPKRRNKQCANC